MGSGLDAVYRKRAARSRDRLDNWRPAAVPCILRAVFQLVIPFQLELAFAEGERRPPRDRRSAMDRRGLARAPRPIEERRRAERRRDQRSTAAIASQR
jgi:hypothetical protein